jgi:hypothetical protein
VNDFDKLELSTETIRELTGDELREVAGGAAQPPTLDGCFTPVLPTHYCPTRLNCIEP